MPTQTPSDSATGSTSRLHIFRVGTHMSAGGGTFTFSEADLRATCEAYDPKVSEAPLVVGHPKLDAPAYGWVQSLAFCDDGIDATPSQVNADFADMVAAGAFKKISAAFYAPDAPQNPVPGVFYLRHVGFLGAQPPAIKGLRSPSFAEDEAGVVEFSEWDDVQNASLWRGLRDWILAKFGAADADAAVPSYGVASLEQGAQQELADARAKQDAQPQPTPLSYAEEITVTPAEKQALEAENAKLKQQLAEHAAAQRAAGLAQVHAAHVAFCEPLITAGKLLPAYRDIAVATLDHLAAQPVEFAEGDTKKPLVEAFKGLLSGLPKVVEFGEVATAAEAAAATGTVSFAAPDGYTVSAEAAALHAKALAHMNAHKCSYMAAVTAVSA